MCACTFRQLRYSSNPRRRVGSGRSSASRPGTRYIAHTWSTGIMAAAPCACALHRVVVEVAPSSSRMAIHTAARLTRAVRPTFSPPPRRRPARLISPSQFPLRHHQQPSLSLTSSLQLLQPADFDDIHRPLRLSHLLVAPTFAQSPSVPFVSNLLLAHCRRKKNPRPPTKSPESSMPRDDSPPPPPPVPPNSPVR